MTATTPTNYWTDYVSGSDSTGDGSELNPWKTMQHALNTITKDSTYGDCINLLSDETIAATLDFSAYGTPSDLGRLTFRGANGVRKTINCNGMYFVNQASPTAKSNTFYESLHFTNYSTYAFYYGTNHTKFVDCVFDKCDPGVFFAVGLKTEFESCFFDWNNGNYWNANTFYGMQDGSVLLVRNCVFMNQMRTILTNRGSFWFDRCIFHAGRRNNSNGVITSGIGYYAKGFRNITNCTFYRIPQIDFGNANCILGTSDDGYGIYIDSNIFVGFNTVSSYAIKFVLASGQVLGIGRNAFYNNTVNVLATSHYLSDWGRNDLVLANNPLTDPDNGDFSLTEEALLQMGGVPIPSHGGLPVGETYPYYGAVQPKYNPPAVEKSFIRLHGV